MIKVLVCDDDCSITAQVTSLLQKIKTSNNIDFEIHVHNNGDFIHTSKTYYDIAIIDIEIPGMNCLDSSRKLKELNPYISIIVLTSYADYLDKAMDISVYRYLSKPIDVDRFEKNFIDAIIHQNNISKQIIIEQGDKVFFVNTRDILFIENLKHGSTIVTKQGKHKTNKKPQDWMNIIAQPNCFIFSHKSYIVNLQNVVEFDRTSVTFLVGNETKTEQCISQRKHTEFRKAFFKFIGGIK